MSTCIDSKGGREWARLTGGDVQVDGVVGEEGGAGGAAGQLLGRQPLEELAGIGVSDGGALLHHVAQLACRGGKAQSGVSIGYELRGP